MNYDRYAEDPIHSSMFNGNASSMGGNGAPSTYGGIPQGFRAPYNKIPSAGGGGCMVDGPFKECVQFKIGVGW
jgi:tyrosinase